MIWPEPNLRYSYLSQVVHLCTGFLKGSCDLLFVPHIRVLFMSVLSLLHAVSIICKMEPRLSAGNICSKTKKRKYSDFPSVIELLLALNFLLLFQQLA